MKGFLGEVIEQKRKELEALRGLSFPRPKRRPPSFLRALTEGSPPRIIAEIKRRSPSRGLLREIDPVEQAKRYKAGGAKALSVLTDSRFGGSADDLRKVAGEVDIPCLRKDFIIDPVQLEESSSLGASAVLLIAKALPGAGLKEMVKRALEGGLEPLVEVQTEEDLERALRTEARIIGINARDLETLEVDLSRIKALATRVPRDRVLVAESGIRDREDLEGLVALGVENFLIGEALVLADDPREKLREFLEGW